MVGLVKKVDECLLLVRLNQLGAKDHTAVSPSPSDWINSDNGVLFAADPTRYSGKVSSEAQPVSV